MVHCLLGLRLELAILREPRHDPQPNSGGGQDDSSGKHVSLRASATTLVHSFSLVVVMCGTHTIGSLHYSSVWSNRLAALLPRPFFCFTCIVVGYGRNACRVSMNKA